MYLFFNVKINHRLFSKFKNQANEASDIEDEISPRLKEQVNRHNFTDFCVKNIDNAEHGRKEVQIAEQGIID